jgi:hypothetical protein
MHGVSLALRYVWAVARRHLSRRKVEKQSERERNVGVDADDEAGRWLAENDPKPPPPVPKSAKKSKTLHRWRQKQQRDET